MVLLQFAVPVLTFSGVLSEGDHESHPLEVHAAVQFAAEVEARHASYMRLVDCLHKHPRCGLDYYGPGVRRATLRAAAVVQKTASPSCGERTVMKFRATAIMKRGKSSG